MRKYYGLTGTKLNIAIGVTAGLDFLLFGYDQGVTGGLLTLGSFKRQFPQIDYYDIKDPTRRNTVSTYQGITVASYNLGCFFGALLTIVVGDKLGRRRTIFLGSSIMIIGAILQCSSYQLPQLIVGRLVTGFGNGFNTSTVPTWQSETSRSHRRGQLVMIEGALITFGIMISYWIDFGFSFIHGSSVDWRFPIAFQIFFAIIIIAVVMGLPESPRWLMLKGRDDEAIEVLSALSAKPIDDPSVRHDAKVIKLAALEESKGTFRDLFTMDENRHFHRTALAYVNQMFQQISGINLITYYAATIYQESIGLSFTLSRLLAACNGTEYFLSSLIAPFIIEKIGRRKLMIFGAIMQSICMAALAVTTRYDSHRVAGIIAALFLFLFNTFFAVGWLGMTWLYPAEIVPLRIRVPANALSTSANWIFNFMVVMITPVAFSSIGYQTYIIFAVINAFIAPAVYYFYPETAYRSLEEMDAIARATTSVLDFVPAAKRTPRMYDGKGEMLAGAEDLGSRAGSDDGEEEDGGLRQRRTRDVLDVGDVAEKKNGSDV